MSKKVKVDKFKQLRDSVLSSFDKEDLFNYVIDQLERDINHMDKSIEDSKQYLNEEMEGKGWKKSPYAHEVTNMEKEKKHLIKLKTQTNVMRNLIIDYNFLFPSK